MPLSPSASQDGSTAAPLSSGFLSDFAHVDRADVDDLRQRLELMQSLEFFRNYKAATFALMEMGSGGKVADVGCGLGNDARTLARFVGLDGKVVGFDESASLLAYAQDHSRDLTQVRFCRAPADRLPAEDGAFDALRTDRLYVHLPDPLTALREAVRVVRPGGRIVVSEADMASFWVATDLPEIAWQVTRGVAESVANAPAARRLSRTFAMAELVDVSVEVRTLVSSDARLPERLINMDGVVQRLVAQARITEDEARHWMTEWTQNKESGQFLGGLSFFIVAGRKPG